MPLTYTIITIGACGQDFRYPPPPPLLLSLNFDAMIIFFAYKISYLDVIHISIFQTFLESEFTAQIEPVLCDELTF